MPRLPRIYIEGALSYITCGVMPNQKLFEDPEDYQKYLQLLIKGKSQHKFKLFSFLLLPTKIILLMELRAETSISEIMHSINSTYTKYFNSRYGKKGHLFKGRYNVQLIEKNPHLLPLTRYIHLKAGKNSEDYPYSSYPVFINKVATPSHPLDGSPLFMVRMEEEIEEVLNYLPDKDYENYVKVASKDEMESFGKKLYRRQFVGSLEFEKKVKSEIEVRQQKKEGGEEKVEVKIERHFPKRFAFATSFAILFLLSGTIYFYSNNNRGQNQLEITQSQLEIVQKRLEIARKEFNQKLSLLKEEAKKEAEKRKRVSVIAKQPVKPKPAEPQAVAKVRPPQELKNPVVARPSVWQEEKTKLSFSLEGSAWEIELKSASGRGSKKDRLIFNDGKFNSSLLSQEGFPYSNYSLTYKDNGTVTWETMQTNPQGETANWYGEWKGNRMRGILYQKKAGEEKNFSFVAIGRQSIS